MRRGCHGRVSEEKADGQEGGRAGGGELVCEREGMTVERRRVRKWGRTGQRTCTRWTGLPAEGRARRVTAVEKRGE